MIWRLRSVLKEALAALRNGDTPIAELDIREALRILDDLERDLFEPKKPWCWP